MGYWLYYLGFMALTFALQRPWVMVGVLVFIALRPFIPDPIVLARTWGKIRALDAQIAANPANITARRDLAIIWLERLRPGRALELLDEARRRAPDDAELLYLTGLARMRCGDPEGALAPLVRAVELEPRLRYGDPYLAAAEALLLLGRLEEAEDALERFTRTNSSAIQGHVLLSDVRRKLGDAEGAKTAIREALDTWKTLPRYRRRSQVQWWVRAWVKHILG
ncbi:tetratricopeptide repeat protein [Polyangium mundeleinium]|uniref:Tetratricopeptide repeat protein n=1 Tax=Polyangium mundeleinium TaxID=2995306 RepID=A0ABT5F0L4_9BACT|nr:tetratricopeptide repeat protein [Polyangium mundeleinium]MDC0747621.1 tetratricopeptide repeat protein [Polyangium mundeleinium]